MTESRLARIEECLVASFHPSELQIKDQSHLHAGHAGAATGMGHFAVRIVSSEFEGLSKIQRHRKVYESLGSLLETDIHAVNIQALTASEIRSSGC